MHNPITIADAWEGYASHLLRGVSLYQREATRIASYSGAFVVLEDNDLRFGDAKLDRISFKAKDGGTCSYAIRLQVHPEDGDEAAAVVDRLHLPGVRGTLEVPDEALEGHEENDNE